jgi:alkanesulfonate monooxygenase SsuD/methylene tetrahydromethanopterin reductase-like flavin-dependent oxidoreductase (luciferase family)
MALNNHRPTVLSNLEIKLEEIIQFLKEEKGVYEGLIAQPKNLQYLPDIVWLGSGMTSAEEAARHGVGYSFAAFMNRENGTGITEAYLDQFDRSQYASAPSLQVAVAVSVADNIEQARQNAYGMAYQFLQSRQLSNPEVLLPPEAVMQRIKSGADEEVFFKTLDQIIVETPQSVYGRLEKI